VFQINPFLPAVKTDAVTASEGNWEEVMTVIGKAHSAVHEKGVVRVQSSMRVGSR
jgi:uncharacterized protein YqgV (UPF0045/DUF77 family)